MFTTVLILYQFPQTRNYVCRRFHYNGVNYLRESSVEFATLRVFDFLGLTQILDLTADLFSKGQRSAKKAWKKNKSFFFCQEVISRLVVVGGIPTLSLYFCSTFFRKVCIQTVSNEDEIFILFSFGKS